MLRICICTHYSHLARPPPTSGSTLEIGFLGTVLNVEIPHGERVQYFQPMNVGGNGKGKQKQQLGLSGIGGEVFDPRVHVCFV